MLSKELEIEKIDTIANKLSTSAEKTINFFKSNLTDIGSYGEDINDICHYYKSPMMFIYADKDDIAILVLQYIQKRFLQNNGDFISTKEQKSIKPELTEYWSYTNGWILRAAQRLNLTNITVTGQLFIDKLYNEEKKGFLTNHYNQNNAMTDILTTSHLGLLNLEQNNLERAISSGFYLCDAILKQPCIEKGLYLRMGSDGMPITDFSQESSPFYFVDKNKPDQLYFMIGYPAAFLTLLYIQTKNKTFLDNAKIYLDYALSCNENIFSSNFSHKIAWAASLLYKVTGEDKYLVAIEKIANHFLFLQQENGMWYYNEDKNASFDQSAEIVCWFLEIQKNLLSFKNKIDFSRSTDSCLFSSTTSTSNSSLKITENERKGLNL